MSTTNDPYSGFPVPLAALAKAGETRITKDLSDDALVTLELPDALCQYRTAALAMLRSVTALQAAKVAEDVKVAYIQARLDAEVMVCCDNAHEHAQRAQRFADAHWKDHLQSLARRNRMSELAEKQRGSR